MFTTVESSTTMSWASATVVRVHQRREATAGMPLVAGEVWVMPGTLYGSETFRNYPVSERTA
jgi:hypothetical protein